jgi:hypothetical protein
MLQKKYSLLLSERQTTPGPYEKKAYSKARNLDSCSADTSLDLYIHGLTFKALFDF